MSIRLQVDGAAGAKGQLSEVAKGVYGIAAAEKAAEMAAHKRVAAQSGGGSPTVGRKIGTAFRSIGSIGPAGGAINASLAGFATIGPLGLALAGVSLGARAIMAVNDRYIASLVAVNNNVRNFSDTLNANVKDIGMRGISRLTGASEDEKYEIRAAGGPKAAALLQAELIKKQIEDAEDARLSSGIGSERGRLGATVSPGSAQLMAFNAEEQKKIDNLRTAADNEGFVSRGLRFWGGLAGGEGNAQQKLDRAVEDFGAAIQKMTAEIERSSASGSSGY